MEDKAEADQKIKNLTNCEYCHHKFHKPVVLPCGDTLCEKHLTEMIQCTDESQHHIFCFFCGQQHLLDGQIGYPENKVLQRLVDIETTKSEIRYEEVKTMCNKLRSKIIEIEEIQKSPGDFITDYFNKIRLEVDHAKSEFQIGAEKSKEFIFDRLALYHTECEAALDTIKLPVVHLNMHELEKFLNEKYRFFFVTLVKDFYETERTIKELEKMTTDVDKVLKELRDCVFLGRSIYFKHQVVDSKMNIFGELKLEYSDVVAERKKLMYD